MRQNGTRSARATRKCPCCRDMPAPTYKLNICAVGERPVEDVLCALSCQPRWHSTQTWVLCQQEYLLSLHEFGSCHRHWGWATPLWPATERRLHGIPLAVTRQWQHEESMGAERTNFTRQFSILPQLLPSPLALGDAVVARYGATFFTASV